MPTGLADTASEPPGAVEADRVTTSSGEETLQAETLATTPSPPSTPRGPDVEPVGAGESREVVYFLDEDDSYDDLDADFILGSLEQLTQRGEAPETSLGEARLDDPADTPAPTSPAVEPISDLAPTPGDPIAEEPTTSATPTAPAPPAAAQPSPPGTPSSSAAADPMAARDPVGDPDPPAAADPAHGPARPAARPEKDMSAGATAHAPAPSATPEAVSVTPPGATTGSHPPTADAPVGVAEFRTRLLARVAGVNQRLLEARHTTTITDRLADGGDFRFTVLPWSAPFDDVEVDTALLEIALVDAGNGVRARFRVGHDQTGWMEERRVPTARAESGWIDRLLLDFVGEALSL